CIWDIRLRDFRPFWTASVSYSPDGTRIISGSWDETLRVWDVVTFECLDVILGSRDIRTSLGAADAPWRAIAPVLETVVESALVQRPIARFSEKLSAITASPGGRGWAGVIGHHLQILQLEGRPV
ncbi:MAG TPA: hypothetical protein PLY87_29545, partial [Planctomycetaceae bacterium]|nr:hypothetical protein [Planctomycetaceae bacterium]HQZ69281.1 hypothetical protein [Planctomycetaceae bacterium]